MVKYKGIPETYQKVNRELAFGDDPVYPYLNYDPDQDEWFIDWSPRPKQLEAILCQAFELGYGGAAGGGKALAIDTPILTDRGYLPMRDVHPGNLVYGVDGRLYPVVAESEIMVNRECFRVTLDNGSTIVADGDHLWYTQNKNEREKGKPGKIRTTREILGIGFSIPAAGRIPGFYHDTSRVNWYITKVEPVDSVPVKCIQVDSPGNLYLAGIDLVPTHNSDLMIGLALTQHRRSLIMRREYPQLKAIIDRIKEILGNRVIYSGMDKVFTGLPPSTTDFTDGKRITIPGNTSRIIELGSCPHLGDEERYQGRPHDFLAYDELTHFNKSQFTFLQGWVRSTDPDVTRCRVLATFNPPTNSDGLWVKERYYPWISGEVNPGEILWYAVVDGEEIRVDSGEPFDHNGSLVIPLSRSFIPARLDDNPDLARTNYRAVIMGLPEPLRSQLLNGDFTAEVGTDAYQLFPTDWVKQAVNRWYGYTKDYPENNPVTGMGVDVARGGQANTVIASVYGDYVANLVKVKGHLTKTGDDVATLVMSYHRNNCHVWIDIGGVGASPYDALKPYLKHLVSPFNGADKSFRKDKSGLLRFYNKRAEAYWRVRELLDPSNGAKLALPDDKELITGLTAIHWSLTPRGILIEDKEEINKRLGRSTDPEDALIYALYPRPQKIFTGGSYVQP